MLSFNEYIEILCNISPVRLAYETKDIFYYLNFKFYYSLIIVINVTHLELD